MARAVEYVEKHRTAHTYTEGLVACLLEMAGPAANKARLLHAFGFLQRTQGKLENEKFVAKAPPDVVEKEKVRMAELREARQRPAERQQPPPPGQAARGPPHRGTDRGTAPTFQPNHQHSRGLHRIVQCPSAPQIVKPL